MPNGVICGGAVDGSNQLGAIVTCQAMTACPDGAGSAARGGVVGNTRATASSKPMSARRKRSARNGIMTPSLDNLDLCLLSFTAASAANLQQNFMLRLKSVLCGDSRSTVSSGSLPHSGGRMTYASRPTVDLPDTEIR